MRAVLLVLILAIVAILAALWSGFLNINQTREARVPNVAATGNGVAASGGQTPAFDVETGSVSVGATQTNVTVPVPNVQVNPPAGNQVQQPQPPQTNTAR